MSIQIDGGLSNPHALFLLQELENNGFVQAESDGWTFDLEDFLKLSPEEKRILGFPEVEEITLQVTMTGHVNRAGASFSWQLNTASGRYDNNQVVLPNLHKADCTVRLPDDVCRAIMALADFSNRGPSASVSDQFQLATKLQRLNNIHLPPELLGKQFIVPEFIQIQPQLNDDGQVVIQPGLQGLDESLNAELAAQIDRKNRVARTPQQMTTTLRLPNEIGEEIYISFKPSAQADLKRIGELRAAPMNRKDFVLNLREDPTLGFAPDSVDLSHFSERVLRVGLFIPTASVVFGQSGNAWIPAIECRDHTGEIKHMLIRDFDGLNRLISSIELAKEDRSGLVSFEDFWFTLENAVELAELCRKQLEKTENTPPLGRIIPIVDKDEDDDSEEAEAPLSWDPYALAERAFTPPPGLAAGIELFPHQRIGVGWLQSLFLDPGVRGGLLADDMGLGKTIQVLSFFHWHRTNQTATDTNFPYLVVAPVALLANWEEECVRFFPAGLTPIVAHGSEARKIPKHCLSRDHLIITNYETLSNQILSWATFDWAVVALDEAQQIKNPGTIKSQAARSLKSGFNIAMTGTPVENQLTDLWAIMDFVEPGFLGTLSAFSKAYIRGNNGSSETQIAASEKLRTHLGHRMLRRVKEDVLEDLPPKTLYPSKWDGRSMHEWALEMTPSQLKAYNDFRHQYELDLSNPEMSGPEAMLKAINGFKYVADHPLVADKRLVPILESETRELISGSAKLQVTMRLLGIIRDSGEKVIVFSGIRLSQQLLAKVIQDTFGIAPPIINGETPVSASRGKTSRQGIIDTFNNSAGFAVLVLSPLAAGVGLNITSANHVIHFTRHWNPAKESQATDRAYRIGQKREVHVYYPMSLTSAFVSFDAVLHGLLQRKMTLAASTLAPTEDLKESDFIDLLQHSGHL